MSFGHGVLLVQYAMERKRPPFRAAFHFRSVAGGYSFPSTSPLTSRATFQRMVSTKPPVA